MDFIFCNSHKILVRAFSIGVSLLLSINALNATEEPHSKHTAQQMATSRKCCKPIQGPPGPNLGNYLFIYSGLPNQGVSAASTFTPIVFDQLLISDGWVVTPTPIPADPTTGLFFQNPTSGIYLVTYSAQAEVPANATFLLGLFNLTAGNFVIGSNGGMITEATTSGVFLLTETFLMPYTANDVLQFQMLCDQLPSGLFKIQPPATIGNYCVSVTITRVQ